MDFGGVVFFGFLAAVIIVPQVLRYRERGRLHETLRAAFERGQPVPPELIAALQWGRRRYNGYDFPQEVYAGWQTRPAPPPTAPFGATATDAAPVGPPPVAAAAPLITPMFVSQIRRDLRRGLIWLAIGVGLLAAGAASYAGLYEVGGAQETLALFAAFGTVPIFVGLTYLALAWFTRDKTQA